MTFATEQFNELFRANIEAAQRYTLLAINATERLCLLNCQAAKDLCTTGGEQMLDLSRTDTAKPLAQWPGILERNMGRAAELTRTYAEAATRFQNELTQTIQEQLPAINRSLTETVQQMASLAAAGRAEARRGTEMPEPKAKKAA